MFDVSGTQITITAGDTGLLTLSVRTGDGLYVPGENDRAVFTVREQAGARAALEKVLVPDGEGRVRIALTNADTERLRAGSYLWDVRYALDAELDAKGNVTGGREVITPLPPSPFVVMKAVGDV